MSHDPFQARLAPLAEVPGMTAALVVFHPSASSMEARFRPDAGETPWRILQELADKYRGLGASEEVDEAVSVDGVAHRLVATTVDRFLKEGTPFLVALVAAESVTDDARAAFRRAIQGCMGAVYGR